MDKFSKLMWKFFFAVSILLNLYFTIEFTNEPTYKLGLLTQDIAVKGLFEGSYDNKILFKLPKGMIVRDSSPRNIAAAGLFEPNRISFNIIVSDKGVDYSQSNNFTDSDSLYSYEH